jgi:hypothetical protein
VRARHLAPVAVLASLLLVVPTTQAAEPRPADRGTARAERALDHAKALFTRTPGRRGDGSVAPVEATMVLRELALSLDELSGDDRVVAKEILARPTGGGDQTGGYEHDYTTSPRRTCTKDFCFHWVDPLDAPSNRDRVPRANSDDARVPQWVKANVRAFKTVHTKEIGRLGFRGPKADTSSAASDNKKFDVYLQQLGDMGIYGFCTSDDPQLGSDTPHVSSYCVLDNDMSEFAAEPAKSLKVTAAHEFFHAVQFNYDWREDAWFMEGTATWVEDVVYDGIDDNLQFLATSALTQPRAPLDRGRTNPYGSWVFWRFLTEYLAHGTAEATPSIIRKIWAEADGSKGYSAQATARVVRSESSDLARAFADFAVWNRKPQSHYAEGNQYAARGYIAPLSDTTSLSRATRSTKERSTRLDHLSSATYRYTSDDSLNGDGWKLRVSVDLPPARRGSRAMVTVHTDSGSSKRRVVTLNAKGVGAAVVPFAPARVSGVELTLANGSTRYTCNRGTSFSCRGKSLDDDLKMSFRAKVVR